MRAALALLLLFAELALGAQDRALALGAQDRALALGAQDTCSVPCASLAQGEKTPAAHEFNLRLTVKGFQVGEIHIGCKAGATAGQPASPLPGHPSSRASADLAHPLPDTGARIRGVG